MLAEKVRDLGLDRLGQKGTCPVAQDFCELIVEDSWLNQLDDVIVGHGISLLWWRSGGVKHPHDMPPSRFPPSPTFGDSSIARQAALSGIARVSAFDPHVGTALGYELHLAVSSRADGGGSFNLVGLSTSAF